MGFHTVGGHGGAMVIEVGFEWTRSTPSVGEEMHAWGKWERATGLPERVWQSGHREAAIMTFN